MALHEFEEVRIALVVQGTVQHVHHTLKHAGKTIGELVLQVLNAPDFFCDQGLKCVLDVDELALRNRRIKIQNEVDTWWKAKPADTARLLTLANRVVAKTMRSRYGICEL